MSSIRMPTAQESAQLFYRGRTLSIPISADGKSWPVASDQYLYCWQALVEVGNAMHGSEWSFYDLIAMVPGRPPELVRPSASGELKEDDAYWESEAKKWKSNHAAHMRLMAVLNWFGDELRNGRVVAFTLKSGRMLKIDQGYWFGKAAHDNAFSAGMVDGHFLFIGRNELMARLALIREPEIAVPSTAEGLHLSPYMKLMLAVIGTAHIVPNSTANPNGQSSIESLKAEFVRLAPQFGLQVNPYWGERDRPEYKTWTPDKGHAELSNRLLDVMPSLIREISDQTRRG